MRKRRGRSGRSLSATDERWGHVVLGAVTTGLLVALFPAPADAHGVGARSDLPLPTWQVAWSGAVTVLVSFLAAGLLWSRPHMHRAASGRPLPSWLARPVEVVAWVVRILVFLTFVVVLVAAWAGPTTSAENFAPFAVYVAFWVGLQFASAVVGDVWSVTHPVRTLAWLAEHVRRGVPAPRRDVRTRTPSPSHTKALGPVVIACFLWLELCYHTPDSPRVLAVAISTWMIALALGAALWGSEWIRSADGFAVLFRAISSLAPVARASDGRLRFRWPATGLTEMRCHTETTAVILVTLGGTTFDGLSRTRVWQEALGARVGWDKTFFDSLGLIWTIGLVSVSYAWACRLSARTSGEEPVSVANRYAPSLVPIALAYAVAHYFSLLVFEGQRLLSLASDPLGVGWDLFGTADWKVDYTAVSPTTIAWVQAISIVLGHVVGVLSAHDKAVATHSRALAVRSQYPLVVVMISYTVAALFLLLRA